VTHPEQLPPPGDLLDTADSVSRMFDQVDAALRDAADWRAGRAVANGPDVELRPNTGS
jgi:hypothetical protein